MGRILRGLARFIGNIMGASQPGFYPEAVRGVPVPEPEDSPPGLYRPVGAALGDPRLVARPPSKARRKKR